MERFPNRFGKTKVVLRDSDPKRLFEGSTTYKVGDTGRYVTMVEAQKRQGRYFRSWISISMSGKGSCYDNAMIETFFKTIKSELVWRTVFYARAEAATAIVRYTDNFYNPVRRHSALDYISPAQFERTASR